jgi:Tfp pilus assembly protein PilP
MATRSVLIATLIAALCGGAACGGDDEGGGGEAAKSGDDKTKSDAAKKKADDKKKKDADRKKKKAKIEAVSFIPTLERSVPAEEAPTIRRRLKERDFTGDPTGAENRDPFRSYVLPQLVGQTVTEPTTTAAKPTDQCTKNKMIATNYALRDLALIGIIARGAQRFALFRDAKGVGHVVERGKCVAREKAVVTEIGEGHVTVEIVPDAIPGGPEPVAERRSLPLYPNELTVEDLDEAEENGPPTGTETAPVLTPAPTTPAPPPAAPPATQ